MFRLSIIKTSSRAIQFNALSRRFYFQFLSRVCCSELKLKLEHLRMFQLINKN